VPQQLRDEIADYKAENISVHVQVLQDGAAKGIHSPSDTETYAKNLANSCGWNLGSLINVVVSDNPRAYGIYKSGTAETTITQQTVDDARAKFKQDLQDTRTPYLVDALTLLKAIDPHTNNATHGTPNTPPTAVPNPSVGKEQGPPLQIPIIPIGLGLAALGAVGFGGLRLNRGLKVSRYTREGETTALDGLSDASEKLGHAELQLRGLHDDDAKRLRSLVAEAARFNALLGETRQAMLDRGGEQKKRLWPDVKLIDGKKDDVGQAVKELAAKLAAVDTETDKVVGFVVKIDDMITGFQAQITDTRSKANQLVADGWDLGKYNADLETFDNHGKEVVILRAKLYAERPAQIIEEREPQIAALEQHIIALPARREEADNTFAGQTAEITRAQSVVEASNRDLETVRTTYDTSCFEDINETGALLAQKLQGLVKIQSKGATFASVRSLEAVEQSDSLNAQFASATAELKSLANRSHERLQRLRKLEAELPERVEQVDSTLSKLRTYSFNTYRNDVEDDVRSRIEAVSKEFAASRQGLTQAKPAYLELDTNIASQASTINSVMRTAQEQKREMDNLRADVSSWQNNLESELSALRALAMDSDAGISVGLLTIPHSNVSDNRQGLRNQVANYRSLDSQISQLQSQAQSNIAAAERRRREEEEARLRAIAEAAAAVEAAAQAARDAAASASNAAGSWDPPSSSSSDSF